MKTDALLSDAGHRRAECLAKTLAGRAHSQIFTSDLQRTQQTAAPLAEQLHFKPVAIPLSNVDDLIAAIRSEKAANIWWWCTTLRCQRFCARSERLKCRHCSYGIRPLLHSHF